MCFYTFLYLLPPHPKTSKEKKSPEAAYASSVSNNEVERRDLDPPVTHRQKHSCGVLSMALDAIEQSPSVKEELLTRCTL